MVMTPISRRAFLGTVATSAAGARRAKAQAGGPPLRLGLIGCGWYGLVDLRAAFKAGGVEVVGLCDVDSAHLEAACSEIEKAQGRRPRAFKHHNELLVMPELQAVVIATPPHWHALQFIDACRKGLHIYCEKPLSYDVREGRAMVEAAKASSGVAQIGFQRRQNPAVRAAARFIREGMAGRIVQVDAQIHYDALKSLADPNPTAPPPSLDWDLWCGPAPKLPYRASIGHKTWRLEAEYGNGHLVDWGIHWIDAIRTTLDLAMPRSVTAAGGLYALGGRITTPDTLTAHFEFERCPVVWRHRLWGAAELTPAFQNGIAFYGDKATVFVSDGGWLVQEPGKEPVPQPVEPKVDAAAAHMGDFLEAVRSRHAATCSPEDAFRSTATVQLAMIAYRTGTRVVWDEATQTVTGNPAAAALLRRAYRAPWVHPSPA
jgi:predicted dehydrogenase